MSVAGIFTTPYYLGNSSQTIQQSSNGFQQNFAQLGQDLQSGNLSAAEQDFAALQIGSTTTSTSSATPSTNPITQAFQQLSVDLQSGNLTGAQQAYSSIEQDNQTQAQNSQSGQTEGHHHHHHHGGGGENAINQLFSANSTQSSSSSASTQQPSYSFLTQLPYAQPLGQDSSSVSSLSLTA